MHLTSCRRTVLSAAATAFAAAALFAAPASAAPSYVAGGCPDVPTVQPFAPWQDVADYLLAPDGDLEAGGSTWQLEDGARVVKGNSPFHVGGAGRPAGARAARRRDGHDRADVHRRGAQDDALLRHEHRATAR